MIQPVSAGERREGAGSGPFAEVSPEGPDANETAIPVGPPRPSMSIQVAVNGYGTIGKRVADAVQL